MKIVQICFLEKWINPSEPSNVKPDRTSSFMRKERACHSKWRKRSCKLILASFSCQTRSLAANRQRMVMMMHRHLHHPMTTARDGTIRVSLLQEASALQNGWILGETPNGLWPPAPFSGKYIVCGEAMLHAEVRICCGCCQWQHWPQITTYHTNCWFQTFRSRFYMKLEQALHRYTCVKKVNPLNLLA